MIIKTYYEAYTLFWAYVSSIKPLVCLFNRYLLRVYYVPGIAEVLVEMSAEFSPPGVYLLCGGPAKGKQTHE